MKIYRENTVNALNKFGILVNPELPLLDFDLLLKKSNLEVTERMLCICGAAALSFHPTEQKRIYEWISRENLKNNITAIEESFFSGDATYKYQMQWQIEGLFALAWCCNLNLDYYPLMDLPDDLQSHFPSIKNEEVTIDFRENINLRPVKEIISALDTYYCLHSYVRNCQFDGRKSLSPIGLSSIVERRRALEWLFSDENWTEISLDT